MSAQIWAWIGLSMLAWFVAACIVGWLLGGAIQIRNRQVPHKSVSPEQARELQQP